MEKYAYFGAGGEWGGEGPEACSSWLKVWPEYGYPLGEPQGKAAETAEGIYTRSFASGTHVWLNASYTRRSPGSRGKSCIYWANGKTTGDACSGGLGVTSTPAGTATEALGAAAPMGAVEAQPIAAQGGAASPIVRTFADVRGAPYTVDWDSRSMRLGGRPALLYMPPTHDQTQARTVAFCPRIPAQSHGRTAPHSAPRLSGSIHYMRSTPEQWPSLFAEARANGLNAIESYVFWNAHAKGGPPPAEGSAAASSYYDYSGSANVTRFLQLAAEYNLFVIWRFGPYICAEWPDGGLPGWLKQIPGLKTRQYNAEWIAAVERCERKEVQTAHRGHLKAQRKEIRTPRPRRWPRALFSCANTRALELLGGEARVEYSTHMPY
eukprot:7390579-Prymnesium_polylepis.1